MVYRIQQLRHPFPQPVQDLQVLPQVFGHVVMPILPDLIILKPPT